MGASWTIDCENAYIISWICRSVAWVGRSLDGAGTLATVTTRIAVLPGSFDPVTYGHVDIVRRALTLFDQVVVAIGVNASKSALLEAPERVRLFAAATAELQAVRVVRMPGLLADLCHEVGAHAIIKGLRGGADFDAEQPMALMNRHLSGVETVFVTGDPALSHISSSMVKDIAGHSGPIGDLVPDPVAEAVYRALGTHAPQGANTTKGTHASKEGMR